MATATLDKPKADPGDISSASLKPIKVSIDLGIDGERSLVLDPARPPTPQEAMKAVLRAATYLGIDNPTNEEKLLLSDIADEGRSREGRPLLRPAVEEYLANLPGVVES